MASNSTSSSSLSDFTHTIFSYNTNIMLAALISLLLVVLFVLLLHAYANCFFPRRSRPSLTVSYLLAPQPLHPLPFDSASAPSKGLHPSLISAIPLFVYESEVEKKNTATAMECVICLTEFEDREIGRRLRKCGHGFHLECIDMWLDSHANCPVCRTPVESEGDIAGAMEDRNNCEIQSDNEEHDGQFRSSDSSSSTEPPLMSLVASLKRMMSRNRTEGRIFPSSNGVEELDV